MKKVKFELYVQVNQFKKIKSVLANYYATRTNDANMNIIKNTENQLALLATEVITIFDYLKDSKLERKKNINETYKKGKSLVHHIMEEESSILKAKKALMKQNSLTHEQFPHSMLSPYLPKKYKNLKLSYDTKKTLRTLKTTALTKAKP